jgi:hypothetical protein
MNEMDLLARFRAEVPLRVSPYAEELFQAGIHDYSPERTRVPRPANPFARLGLRWRLAVRRLPKQATQTLILNQTPVAAPGLSPYP